MSPLARATRILLERTSAVTGEAFYRGLARGVAECLGVKYGLVGAQSDGASRMQVRAVWRDGAYLPVFEYELEGTPCAQVLDRGFCHFPAGVARQFPADTMLAEMGIESYAGFRVAKQGAGATGIIIGLSDVPTEEIPQDLEALLELFAQRAAAEIERESVERALRESEGRYRQIVTTCAEGVWTIDAEGRTTFVNAQMAEMLGYTPEEMLGQPLSAFMAEEDLALAEANLARRRRGIRERHEFRLRRKGGGELWTVMGTSPLSSREGAFEGALAVVSDLTQQRVLEARIQQAQKLESLGLLAGGVAHDFNNLLVGILGNTGLAIDRLPHESPALPMIRDAQDAAQRLADLTRQMLAYSGKGRFVIEPLDLNRLVEEMSHLLGAVVSKKATLRLNLGRGLPPVTGDATQLRQVVMNLITNASESLGDGEGLVTITTGLVRADPAYLAETLLDDQLAEGDYVFVEVADTGAGMDEATRARMFDPFFTTKFAGRGLGLAAVLGILRGHRGAIKVYSEVGKGTSIKVLLPASRATEGAATSPRAAAPVPALPPGLVLVADDVAVIRDVARRVLEGAGMRVIVARDGLEAVAQIDAHAATLSAVLLDMTMPGLSGEEVFHHIRRVRPEVRVVLSSGYNEQEATSRFVGKGLAGFLQKPWTPAALLGAMRGALER